MTELSDIYDTITVNLRRGNDNGERIIDLAKDMTANTAALDKQTDDFVRLITLITPSIMPEYYDQFTESIRQIAQAVDAHSACMARFQSLFISQLKIEQEVYAHFAELAAREIASSPA